MTHGNSPAATATRANAEFNSIPHPMPIPPHPSFTRRAFLQSGAATAALLLSVPGLTPAAAPPKLSFVDVNVTLSRWPLRRLPHDEPDALAAKLRSHGVTRAWAGTFDGLLHKDLASANRRLAEECRRHGRGLFVPFGSVNPTLPDWAEETRRCAREHRMPGLRLHPNYHGYTLDDPRFERFLRLAAELKLIVQLALVMEDERMMHPRLRVDPVDTAPLATIVPSVPSLRLVLLNALRTLRGPMLPRLLAAGNVSVDIAMLEGAGGLDVLLSQVPADRVLFGSHAPLFYFEAAALKLQESVLTDPQARAIRSANAERLSSTA